MHNIIAFIVVIMQTNTVEDQREFHARMQLWRIDENSFNLRVFNKQFVGLSKLSQNIRIIAGANDPQSTEILQIVRKNGDPNRVRIKANNGLFLQVSDIALVCVCT